MKLLKKMKDGGPDSTVTGYWLIESKRFFSILLLKFEGRSREAFHSHAFDALSWVLKGWGLVETTVKGNKTYYYPSWKPIWTPKNRFHKVDSKGTTWVLSFRGPWDSRWEEYNPEKDTYQTLTHGRKVVKKQLSKEETAQHRQRLARVLEKMKNNS